MDMPEVITFEVLVRLPLKSIARFKALSKKCRSLIVSNYFRDQFISRNSTSSISWSIIQMEPRKLTLEIIGHHGCKTWGLTRSPGSFVSFLPETTIKKLLVLACTDGLVLIYAKASDGTPMYYVGNPLFQEWLRIPLPHSLSLQQVKSLRKEWRLSDTGLVTKMQSGIVVSYKVVWLVTDYFDDKVDFWIYSSDTGEWETRKVTGLISNLLFSHHKSIALNGILHWLSSLTGSITAYDFYGGHDDAFRIVDFPNTVQDYDVPRFKRTFSTSEGSIVYVNEFGGIENRTLRVWKLVKYIDGPEAWQLFREVNSMSLIKLGIDYSPVVMHPLNSEILYLWSRNRNSMILFNLRTRLFSLHKETANDQKCEDGCILSFNRCSEYMDKIYINSLRPFQGNHLRFSQYVLPRWLHRLPRPQPS